MNLVDTHAHLYWDVYKDNLKEVIKRSVESGVTTVINVGVDVKLSKKALRQAQGELANIPGFTAYSTIGIHPHEALRYSQGKLSDVTVSIDRDIEELEQIYRSNPQKVVAVGECGLDYLGVDDAQKNLQRQLFKAQIELAKKLDLPIIAHCRDDRSLDPENSEAWDEILQMIGSHQTILHCFSGLEKTTQKILKMPNALVSFAATITYPKNEYLRKAVKALPLEKVILETDCPFLPPQSKRGQRNEPANLRDVAQLVTELKGVSWEEIAKHTSANVAKLFDL